MAMQQLRVPTRSERIAELERKIRLLEYGRALESASISGGSLDVVDPSDQTAVRMGLLASGDYGIAAVRPDGTEVSPRQLAFDNVCLYNDTVQSAIGPASWTLNPAYGALKVPTGRALIITSARMGLTSAGAACTITFGANYKGVDSDGVTIDTGNILGVRVDCEPGKRRGHHWGYAYFKTDFDRTLTYQFGSYGSATGDVSFTGNSYWANRTIVVLPY